VDFCREAAIGLQEGGLKAWKNQGENQGENQTEKAAFPNKQEDRSQILKSKARECKDPISSAIERQDHPMKPGF